MGAKYRLVVERGYATIEERNQIGQFHKWGPTVICEIDLNEDASVGIYCDVEKETEFLQEVVKCLNRPAEEPDSDAESED